MKIHLLNNFKLPLPMDDIYRRLGRNSHLAFDPRPEKVEEIISDSARFLCFHGAWTALEITGNNGETVIFQDGTSIKDPGTAARLEGCNIALFMAATAGQGIVDARDAAMRDGDGFRAVILDAVGGECADAAVDFTEKSARRELARRGLLVKNHRFSPGYGTLELKYQQIWFALLPLAEWGVKLDEKVFVMTPEKTVTALAGLMKRG